MVSIIRLIVGFWLMSASLITYAQEKRSDGSLILHERSKSKEYGYVGHWKHSINVGSKENLEAFLKGIQGPKGQVVTYSRMEECCKFATPNGFIGVGYLDKVEVIYEGLEEPIYLYFNAYDYDNPKVPLGFKMVK